MHLSDLIAKQTPMPLGWMGVFGTGNFKAFLAPGVHTFEAPAERVRVRVLGGGGGDYDPNGSASGGTSSFANLISATGGQGGTSNSTQPAPGQGFGGDFQAIGGTTNYWGGAAAGSQLGKGGDVIGGIGGAAVGGMNSYSDAGASAYGESLPGLGSYDSKPGPDCFGRAALISTDIFSGYLPERFPFDLFQGMGGGIIHVQSNTFYPRHAGSGAGGSIGFLGGTFKISGGHGGGGGGVYSSSYGVPGDGGYGAGAGASKGSINGTGGAGAGYAHGVLNLVKGNQYQVTVAAGGKTQGSNRAKGGGGLVIVEW